MLSIPELSYRSQRDSIFSIGNSPKSAGLRINSFINHRWKPHPDIHALSRTLYSFDIPVASQVCDSSWTDTPYQRLSVPGSIRSSILSAADDLNIDELISETSSVQIAEVQTHKVIPISSLVYVSKSNAISNIGGNTKSALSASNLDRHTISLEAMSTHSACSKTQSDHQASVTISDCPQASHSKGFHRIVDPFSDSMEGSTFPCATIRPTRHVSPRQQGESKGGSMYSKHAQRREAWPSQYSPAKAPKILPPVPVRVSSIQHGQPFDSRHVSSHKFASETTTDEATSKQKTTARNPPGLASHTTLHHGPSSDEHPSTTHGGSAELYEMNTSTGLFHPTNFVDTLTEVLKDKTIASEDTTLCDSEVSMKGSQKSLSNSRMRNWWVKCLRKRTLFK